MRWGLRFLPILSLLLMAAAPAPLEGWRSVGPELRFAGLNLYGHINGGAELFHEYGFVELRVEDWENEADLQISLETYRMTDARAALGIYLALCGREQPLAGFPHRNSANPWQLTATRGALFVQVNNFAGGEERLPVMAELARRALAEEAEAVADTLPDLLAEFWPGRPMPGSQRLLCGPLSLQPLISLPGENPLGLGAGTCGVSGRFLHEAGVEQFTVIGVEYEDIHSARVVFKDLAVDGSRVRQGSGGTSYSDYEFLDPQGRVISLRLQGRRLRILIQ